MNELKWWRIAIWRPNPLYEFFPKGITGFCGCILKYDTGFPQLLPDLLDPTPVYVEIPVSYARLLGMQWIHLAESSIRVSKTEASLLSPNL